MLGTDDLQSTSFYIIKKLSIYIHTHTHIYIYIYMRARTYTHTNNNNNNNNNNISSKLDHNLVTYKSQEFYIHKHTFYVYILKVNCFHFEKISMNNLTLFWTISHFYRSNHVGIQQNVYCLLF
jgi:hypothetical protein